MTLSTTQIVCVCFTCAIHGRAAAARFAEGTCGLQRMAVFQLCCVHTLDSCSYIRFSHVIRCWAYISLRVRPDILYHFCSAQVSLEVASWPNVGCFVLVLLMGHDDILHTPRADSFINDA